MGEEPQTLTTEGESSNRRLHHPEPRAHCGTRRLESFADDAVLFRTQQFLQILTF